MGQHGLDDRTKALNGSQLHVAVFSLGYVKFKYCLNELCDMLASIKTLIPMFYEVETGLEVNRGWSVCQSIL